MGYETALADVTNAKIKSVSPRWHGEKEANSNWVEIKDIPSTFADRVELIKSLASKHTFVIIRPATYGGKTRIFVTRY